MTNRRVASLTSGLLARKGDARPAEFAADLAAESGEAAGATSAAPPGSGAVAPEMPNDWTAASDMAGAMADAAGRDGRRQRDLRAYAWPTQGAPTDDDLAVPTPPATDPAEQSAAAVRRRGSARRAAILGIAAAVVAAVVAIVVRDGRQDAARLAANTPVGVAVAPGSAAPPVATASAPPAAVAPAQQARDVAVPTAGDRAPAEMAKVPPAPAAAEEKPVRRSAAASNEAARRVREIAPAAGSPAAPPSVSPPTSPNGEFELAPRIPPAPAIKMAGLPPAHVESATSAAALVAPSVEPPSDKPQAVKRTAPRAASKTAKAVASGHYAVQIASIGSKTRAQTERARLARTLGPVLGGRALIVAPAQVAGHGTVYRIRASGYPNQAAANKACTQIKGKGLGCLVVRL